MRIKFLILFTAALLLFNLQPAVSLAAVNSHEHMPGQTDTPEPAVPVTDHNTPGHNADETADPAVPPAAEADPAGDEPAHGAHAGSGSEMNRTGLLGGFGLLNGLIILSAVILKRKTARTEGASGK